MAKAVGVDLRALLALFVVFHGSVCTDCTLGEVKEKNYVKISDVNGTFSYGGVSGLGEINLTDCYVIGKVADLFEAVVDEDSKILTITLKNSSLLEERTPSAKKTHIACFYMKAKNCKNEQRFDVEVEDTNNHDPTLVNSNGSVVQHVTYEVDMPLLKGKDIGIELLAKDVDMTNTFISFWILGKDLIPVNNGTLNVFKKTHKYRVVPTDDFTFSEKNFSILLQDEGNPRRDTRAILTLKARTNETLESNFNRFYYEGTYKSGLLQFPFINYTNADRVNFTLLSEQGYQRNFTLEANSKGLNLRASPDVRKITERNIVLVLVANEPKNSTVQHATLIINNEREKLTNDNCTGAVHVENIENVYINL